MQKEELIRYVTHPEALTEETLAGLKKITEEFPFFHSALILYLKNLKTLSHPDFRQELQRLSIRIPDRKKLYYCLNPEHKKTLSGSVDPVSNPENVPSKGYFSDEANVPESQKDENDLIQKFINSSPSLRITTPHETETLHKDFSQESVSENQEIITETFADLLVQQKKYGKAIEAFRQLSLKFPEKSVYFAGRIEEIRKLGKL